MIFWIRTPHIYNLDSTGLGRMYTSLYRTFYKYGIPFSVSDPNTRCIELWTAYNWYPSCIYNSLYKNFTVGFTTGEDNLDKMKNSEYFDMFFVTSMHYKKLQTTNKPVYVMHLGIEPEYFPYIERNNDKFIFSHIGVTQLRKGSDLACRAFYELFANNKETEMHVICNGTSGMFRYLMRRYYNVTNMKFIIMHVPIENIMSIYYGDCLLFPSLREGWGLHLTEAMATGMPAIVSDLPVFDEQFDDNCGWRIRINGIGANDFANIDYADLCDKMLYVYNNVEECKQKGMYAYERTHKYLTWKYIVDTQLLPVMEEQLC